MRRIAAIAAVVGVVAAACGGSGGGTHRSSPAKRTSIVVLGDSVAAGEGIAYGYVVAQDLHAALASFACTGSSYEHGIVGPATNANRDDVTVLRPAQFGDWQTRTNLNPAYDRAAPDVVLVTLGADDLGFVPVVESCVEA